MDGPQAQTRRAAGFAPWKWAVLVGTAVAAAVLGGLFALLDVIDGNAGEAGQEDWMRNVLAGEVSTGLVFVGAPIVLGVIAGWCLSRLRCPFSACLVTAVLTVAVYLALVVKLGTGL